MRAHHSTPCLGFYFPFIHRFVCSFFPSITPAGFFSLVRILLDLKKGFASLFCGFLLSAGVGLKVVL